MPVIAAGSDRLNCPQAGTLSCLELEPIQDPEKKLALRICFDFNADSDPDQGTGLPKNGKIYR
jgi:hypothetical protein